MKIPNKAMLITYGDSLGENLSDLKYVMNQHLSGVVEGVHILPFYPSSGDRGFAPLTYREVDPTLGTWSDIEAIAQQYFFMTDFMINHISQQSEYFQDFLFYHDKSVWKDLFIRYSNFWPTGEPTQKQTEEIYKRKPRAPYFLAEFADGSHEKVWCTFDQEQIDLDVTTDVSKKFIHDNLLFLLHKGAQCIRLDAFAYANKKVGTNCFFVEPEIWQTLEETAEIIDQQGASLLPEIHEHYTIQQKISSHGYPVYDFAFQCLCCIRSIQVK